MFRLYSKGCEYAIRALMHFPDDADSNVRIEDISARANVPVPFTRKMFQVLAQRGILSAVSGPNGGYRLARRADQISLLQIIEIIDGADPLDACVLGLPVCDDSAPCALHGAWKRAKEALLPEYKRTSVADLFRSSRRDAFLRRSAGKGRLEKVR